MSVRDCLSELYCIHKSREIPELLKKKKELLERVAQIDLDVTQLQNECVTKWAKCDTIYNEYIAQIENGGAPNDVWILTRLKKAGIDNINPKEFLEHYHKQKVD